MKYSDILVVGFAVLVATASVARAEEFNMDFDKGSFRSADFAEALGTQAKNEAPMPAITRMPNECGGNNLKIQMLRKQIFGKYAMQDRELFETINSEKVMLFYNTEAILLLESAAGGKPILLREINNPGLVKQLESEERQILSGGTGAKFWMLVKNCYKVVEVITVLWQGKEILKEVTREVCESTQEWVDSPSTGNSGGPYISPNQAAQARGAVLLPAVN